MRPATFDVTCMTTATATSSLSLSWATSISRPSRTWPKHCERAAGVLVVIDLSACTFMDSTGLRVVIEAHRVARSHDRPLILVCTAESPSTRIVALAAERRLPSFANVGDALASVGITVDEATG